MMSSFSAFQLTCTSFPAWWWAFNAPKIRYKALMLELLMYTIVISRSNLPLALLANSLMAEMARDKSTHYLSKV
jgi:hypothetical protein